MARRVGRPWLRRVAYCGLLITYTVHGRGVVGLVVVVGGLDARVSSLLYRREPSVRPGRTQSAPYGFV